MNKFLTDLMKLADELNKSEGFDTVVIINEMELLYQKHLEELKIMHAANINLLLPKIEATMRKYDAVPTDWKHFFEDLKE